VAGFAVVRAVLRWFGFKILSLWRRHIGPVFALCEALGGLSGLLVWFWWPPVVGRGCDGVALGLSAEGDRVCAGVRGLCLWRRHTRPSFALFAESRVAAWELVADGSSGTALVAGCDGAALGAGIPSETDASFGDTPTGPAALGTGVSS
jgi:hypothetical protein